VKIRKTNEKDLERIMEIYAYAREQMAKTGNPNQWGPTNWPPESLIRRDIEKGNSYVCVNDDGKVAGTFYYEFGKDIEPGYLDITDGEWMDDSPYGVVHRVASDGSEKGIGSFCINTAFGWCGHLRMDTHGDNRIMQSLLKKLGFVHCGTVYVEEDDYPRLAFEKTGGGMV
jgi:GNAT superfamily N-acetyltransferase